GKARQAKTENWLIFNENVYKDVALRKGSKQKELAEILSEVKELSFADAAGRGYSSSVCNGLIDKGIAKKDIRIVRRYSYEERFERNADIPILTSDQEKALEQIRGRSDDDHRPVLIHGVTGSGKTELYMRLIAETLAKGKQVIVLLPEIALTPQFISIFENRFKGKIALFHSRLSQGERRDSWFAFRNGTARIALGARSCVFAPACDLGMIIIDEEHEDTYEQDSSPRFHARKAAELRCCYHNADLVLGSATPSFESFEKAKSGEYLLISLPHRVGNTPLPYVSIVDMRKELKDGWLEVVSRELMDDIHETLANGKQVILFLNRLGYNTFVSCRDCGFVFRCPECGISLTSYADHSHMKCTRCGYKIEFDHKCPECGSKRIRTFGLGIERLESIIRRLFPDAVIDRIDSDSVKEKGTIEGIYERMKNRETQILLGTRMIAKGWDFSDVDLIGIITAEYMLNFPDFRAGEKAFQMIAQVSGRCGRSDKQGKVVLQTYHPEEPVLLMAGLQDYETYFQYESVKRSEFGYPPYAHMMRIVFSFSESDSDQKYVVMNEVRSYFNATDRVRIFGPSIAIYMDQRKEKWNLTFIGDDLDILREVIREGIEKLKAEKLIFKDTSVQVETDPMHAV
ncbi:MAG: primosomal protein N', partial [Firmicutes bacterium]|nr:primosomal protein N' [Bacillota bacterium]